LQTLRIFDLKGRVLAFDLRDLLDLLAPLSLEAEWVVSAIKPGELWPESLEATGEAGERLEILAQRNALISGVDLAALAKTTVQVIWGEFVGLLPVTLDNKWGIIRAFDSSFYEVTSCDEEVLKKN
jgi:hypothetical protein